MALCWCASLHGRPYREPYRRTRCPRSPQPPCFSLASAMGDCEGFPGEDVPGGLVVRKTDADEIRVHDAAPCGVHGVGRAVLAVGADDQHRHGYSMGLEPKSLRISFLLIYRGWFPGRYVIRRRAPTAGSGHKWRPNGAGNTSKTAGRYSMCLFLPLYSARRGTLRSPHHCVPP